MLLDKEGHPHVADFGLALHETVQGGRTDESCGTLAYMAPEQLRGETHRLDGRADIWALGVMLYEMLTGRRPFAGESWAEFADEILNRAPKPPRQGAAANEIPAELERICLKCLNKEPTGRYTNAGDLAADLRRWLRPRRGRRKAALAAGLATVAALTVLAAVVFHKAAGPPPALRGALNVLIWNNDLPARRGLSLRDPGALPLRRNDRIRVDADLNRPAYVYLLWIDGQGQASPVFPGRPGRWERRGDKESPIAHLSLPEAADAGWPLKGPAGMETLVLLARRAPCPPI